MKIKLFTIIMFGYLQCMNISGSDVNDDSLLQIQKEKFKKSKEAIEKIELFLDNREISERLFNREEQEKALKTGRDILLHQVSLNRTFFVIPMSDAEVGEMNDMNMFAHTIIRLAVKAGEDLEDDKQISLFNTSIFCDARTVETLINKGFPLIKNAVEIKSTSEGLVRRVLPDRFITPLEQAYNIADKLAECLNSEQLVGCQHERIRSLHENVKKSINLLEVAIEREKVTTPGFLEGTIESNIRSRNYIFGGTVPKKLRRTD